MKNQHILNKTLIHQATFIALISFILSGCLLDISAGNGGSIHIGSKSGVLCNPECSLDTTEADGEAYYAVADTGYMFSHWEGATGLCTEEEGNVCTVEYIAPTGVPTFDDFQMELTAVFIENEVGTSISADSPWIGEWIMINYLSDYEEGWDDYDSSSGIGMTASITADKWTEINDDDHCEFYESYTMSGMRFTTRMSGSSCPGFVANSWVGTGWLELSDDNNFMFQYFDDEDEIYGFKWRRGRKQ